MAPLQFRPTIIGILGNFSHALCLIWCNSFLAFLAFLAFTLHQLIVMVIVFVDVVDVRASAQLRVRLVMATARIHRIRW
jgi:hypothetical protein